MLKKLFLFLFVLLCFFPIVSAEKTSGKDLYRYTLSNGLELYVTENHSVPLVYIEIAVKAGAAAQTPETDGLFHLYEHMMFRGNAEYTDASAVLRALNDMGVSGLNGSTEEDHVNYFFTVPSGLLYKGLEFWSSAMRTPLIKSGELEAEKKVVLSEIQGYESDPDRILPAFCISVLFPGEPWKLDSAGVPSVIRNATVEELRTIQKKYYIPNNTALFAGGDVYPDVVYEDVKKLYGNWEKGNDPWTSSAAGKGTETGPDRFLYYVYPDSRISMQQAVAEVLFRAPDTDTDREGVYAAHMFTGYLSQAESHYKSVLCSDQYLKVPGYGCCAASYEVYRRNSMINFTIVMNTPDSEIPERTKRIVSRLYNTILPDIAYNKQYLSGGILKNLSDNISTDRIYTEQTPSGQLSALRSVWERCGADYYLSYPEKMKKVTQKNVMSMIQNYLTESFPVTVVVVNPEIYEMYRKEFSDAGFVKIESENAFWWQQGAQK